MKKWSLKKKVWTSVLTIVILSLIISVIYANFKPEELPNYQTAKVSTGDLQTTFDTQGLVVSDKSSVYKAAAGVKVLTVDVAVGDHVEEGQRLATFDVSTLQPQIAAYNTAVQKAQASYQKSADMNENAKAELDKIAIRRGALNREILEKEAEIAKHEKTIAKCKETAISTEAEIQKALKQLEQEQLSKADIDAVKKALDTYHGDLRAALQENLSKKKAELAKLQAEQSTLDAQEPLFEAQTDATMTDLYHGILEQKKAERDAYMDVVEALKSGWTAKDDGIVTEIALVAGECFAPKVPETALDMNKILSMASGDADAAAILSDIFSTTAGQDKTVTPGIVLESYGDFYADFTVGKYDLQNLKVGQKATVHSLGKTYDAEVTYVSATASAQAGFDISSIASSITGGGASSTNSAAVRVKIAEPDEKIVIGFDVDVQIDTEKLENITKIPVEAVTAAEGENCVFVYNAENKRVELRRVTLGVGTDAEYQVLDGLKLGETVVLNPKTILQDGDKITSKS